MFDLQSTKAKNGKLISRSDHQQYYEQNKAKLQQNISLYRRRQAIVEHPYGTIKRYWGFYYVVTKKGMQRANADVGLIFTAYSLKRIINIIDPETLKAYLKKLGFFVIKICAL